MRWRGSNQKQKTMTAEQTVAEASNMAGGLMDFEASRCGGSIATAAERVSARYGIDSGILRALRQPSRMPKEIAAHVFLRIAAAYEAECRRQMRRLQHDIETTKAITGPFHAAVRAAEAVVGEEVGNDGDI